MSNDRSKQVLLCASGSVCSAALVTVDHDVTIYRLEDMLDVPGKVNRRFQIYIKQNCTNRNSLSFVLSSPFAIRCTMDSDIFTKNTPPSGVMSHRYDVKYHLFIDDIKCIYHWILILNYSISSG